MESQIQVIKQIDGQDVMDSRDVAKMIGRNHKNLIRDVRRYINDFDPGSDLSPAQFFVKSSYIDQNGQERLCYLLTKQGCEFVANKLTGKKGNQFTFQYVSLFNEYQAEHEGKRLGRPLSGEALEVKKRELAYKEAWLAEMRKQNTNKAHELRNDDARLYLTLAEIADNYDEAKMAVDFRNEAITTMQALPVGARREFTATDIATKLGVTPLMIGKWASKLGIKRNTELSYKTAGGAWRYFPEALELFEKNKLEIQEDYFDELPE